MMIESESFGGLGKSFPEHRDPGRVEGNTDRLYQMACHQAGLEGLVGLEVGYLPTMY